MPPIPEIAVAAPAPLSEVAGRLSSGPDLSSYKMVLILWAIQTAQCE
jgi:hypothetical protein